MARVAENTKTTLKGPWLLDAKTLKKLDATLKKDWTELQAFRSSHIAEWVDKALNDHCERYKVDQKNPEALAIARKALEEQAVQRNYPLSRSTREISVKYDDGRVLSGETFEEIGRGHHAHKGHAVSFAVKMDVADISVDIGCGGLISSDETLRLNVTPADKALAQSIHANLRTFFEAAQLSVPVRAVKAAGKFGVWLGAGFMIYIETSTAFHQERVANPLLEEARAFAAKGVVSAADQARALELLLRLQTEVVPATKTVTSSWLVPWFIATIIAATVLSVLPSVEVGIGGGDARIKRWKWWIGLLYVTIPVSFFTGVVLPYLGPIAKKLFSG